MLNGYKFVEWEGDEGGGEGGKSDGGCPQKIEQFATAPENATDEE